MRSILITLCLLWLLAGFSASACRAQVCGIDINCLWPTPNVAYFPFEDFAAGGDATNWVDNQPALWQGDQQNLPAAGLIGAGSQTNDEDGGSNEHYRIDLPQLNGAGGLTVALWFNQNLGVNDNSLRTGLFNSRDLGWTLDGESGIGGVWGVSLGENGAEKGFDARINSSSAADVADENPGTRVLPGTTLADGQTFVGFPTEDRWRHVALTWDGQTGDQKLYLDGQLLGEGVNPFAIGTIDNSVGWRIGDDPCCNNREFTGTLDELGVWDTPLSGEEIEEIFFAGLVGVGLIPPPPLDPPDPVPFHVIQQNFFTFFGATRAQGDVTGDGAVEWADFREWKINGAFFGATAVPEPTTTWFVMGVFAFALTSSRTLAGNAAT